MYRKEQMNTRQQSGVLRDKEQASQVWLQVVGEDLFLAWSGLSFLHEARGRHSWVRSTGMLIQDLGDLV